MSLLPTSLTLQLRKHVPGVCVCVCLVAQSSLILCNSMDSSPPGSSVHGDSPGKNTGVSCQVLLQGIFLVQGSNPGLPHYRWILHCLNHQGILSILEWVAYPFSRGECDVYCDIQPFRQTLASYSARNKMKL